MTRSITAARTAAACAILLVAAQLNVSAQSKAAPPKAETVKAAPTKAPVLPQTEASDSITLTGCLEADGRKYMLTDLQGSQAPKARNWKTGFITKKSRDVEVVAASSSLKLGDHLGHTVSIVGVRDGDTHLKARSIKQLATSCS